MTTLKAEISTLTRQKEALLIDHGYSSDYLKPLFDCKDCEDTGFVEGERCHCLQNELMNFAYGQSNLGHILSQENFNTYSLDYYSAEALVKGKKSPKDIASRNYKICYDFAAKFGQTYSNLLLHGQAGLGKTFLCNSIAKEVLDQGHSVIYLTAFHLFKLISEYRFRNDDDQVSYDDIQAIYDCDLLIIDDLGTENSNSFTTSELFSLINSRLLDEKPVVISTNLSPNTLGTQYTDRIVSRIIGNYLSLGFLGSDIRLQKKFN
jgi:DNA replication protein DnaC